MTSAVRRPALYAVAVVLAVVLATAASAAPADDSPRAKRAEGDESSSTSVEAETEVPVKVCHNSTPCGWAVYTPFTRVIEYFVQNTCQCSTGRKCERAEDDISVKAYVYRCLVVTTTSSTEEAVA